MGFLILNESLSFFVGVVFFVVVGAAFFVATGVVGFTVNCVTFGF